jgi:hypothetical protein
MTQKAVDAIANTFDPDENPSFPAFTHAQIVQPQAMTMIHFAVLLCFASTDGQWCHQLGSAQGSVLNTGPGKRPPAWVGATLPPCKEEQAEGLASTT